MRQLRGTLSLGDVDDVEALARSVLAERLRRTGRRLSDADTEEAIAWLIGTTWELWIAWNPRGAMRSFGAYAQRVLQHRLADHLQARRLGPDVVSLTGLDEAVAAGPVDAPGGGPAALGRALDRGDRRDAGDAPIDDPPAPRGPARGDRGGE